MKLRKGLITLRMSQLERSFQHHFFNSLKTVTCCSIVVPEIEENLIAKNQGKYMTKNTEEIMKSFNKIRFQINILVKNHFYFVLTIFESFKMKIS